MSRRSVLRRLLDPILALSILAGIEVGKPLLAQAPAVPPPRSPGTAPPPKGTPASGQDAAAPALRYVRNVPGEATPIILAADEAATWYESDQVVVVLLRGQAFVQQGTFQLRGREAVARFDLKHHRERGIWKMDLYAEGQIRIDTSADSKEGSRAAVDLVTRGEIKVESVKAKAVQQSRADDPLYRRALAERSQILNQLDGPAAQPSPIQPVGMPSAPRPVMAAPVTPQPLLPSTLPAPSVPVAPLVSPPGPLKPLSAAPSAEQFIARASTPDGDRDQERSAPFLIVRGQPPDPPPPSNNLPVPFSLPGPPTGGPAVVSPPMVPSTPVLSMPTPLPPPSRPAPRPDNPTVLAPGRTFSVRPRFGSDFQLTNHPLGNGENAYLVSGGVIVNVRGVPGIGQVDLEADRLVIFAHGKSPDGGSFRQPQSVGDGNHIEFYLSGFVEIREQDPKRGERIIRADEIYYDVDRNVAIALSAQLELRQPNLPDPVIVKADEVLRTSKSTYEVTRGELFDTKLTSDPGLKIYYTHATIEDKTLPKLNLFGQQMVDRATGRDLTHQELYVRARNVFFEVESVPFFYLPYLAGDARDPLGPIENLSAGYNNIFGAEFGVVLNAYSLLGIQPYDGTRWRLMLDYYSLRGPEVGTTFEYSGKDYLGLPSEHYDGLVNLYGIYDQDTDNLGGFRPVTFQPTGFRGRALWRQSVNDLPYGFTVQSQVAALSDRNYLEQYDKNEWDTGLNRNTYLYVKEQGDFWAWTGLASDRLGRQWMTETEWLPRADGYLFGLSPFDQFVTYSAHASAAWAQLRITNDPGSIPVSPTDVGSNSGRFDVMQELSVPLYLGPVKVVPYGVLDLAEYTQDLNGDSRGRIWGGAGVKASIPFTRLFPDVQSELFNLDGINHKISLNANYLIASTNESHYLFAQFDRLNDEASDQAVRDVRQSGYTALPPSTAQALVSSPYYDPQVYAMRRLLLDNSDLLDTIQALQLELHQRWQTRRGFPGAEHVVDWMTLDLSATIFPAPSRDDFGQAVAFLGYDWIWNVGDRTALVSSALVDPGSDGTKIFTAGVYLNRPDRTNFYLGYRQIEPLESRLVTGAVTYIFSPKYSMTFSAAYDFGPLQAQTNQIVMTRVGTDLQVSAGLSYNSLQSSVGVVFEIVPNLAAGMRRGGGLGSLAGPTGPLR